MYHYSAMCVYQLSDRGAVQFPAQTLFRPMMSLYSIIKQAQKMRRTKTIFVSHCSSQLQQLSDNLCTSYYHSMRRRCGIVDPNSPKFFVPLQYRMPLSAKNYKFSVTNIR